jgi:hypothetical protein
MSIKISLYDFFAYTIPGGFYLFTIAYVCSVFGLIALDFQALSNLSVIQVLLIAAPAYVAGLLIDRIAAVWYRLFKPKNFPQVVLDEFQATYTDFEFKFQGRDWPILIAYLRRENIDPTPEIDRFNVTHIMLKNIGFNFIILAVIEAVQFTRTNFLFWHLISCLALVVVSVIAGRQAARFNKWFYTSNYEAIIARSLEQTDLLMRKAKTVQTSSESGVT